VYFRKALEGDIKTELDQISYIKAARRLSEILLVKGDYEGSIQIALPAVKRMEELGIGSDIDYAILFNNIGCCQINLGRDDEANESFIIARGHYINRWSTDSTGRGLQEAVIGTAYTSKAYINTRRYAKSVYWINRTEMLLDLYREKPDARLEYFDEYKGRIEIMRAVAQMGLEHPDSAVLAYEAFLQTAYSKTSAGRINANDYLMAAGRYVEAADNYRYLNQMLDENGIDNSLDNIQLYLLPKVRANIAAERIDSVIGLSAMLCDAVDSAILKSKNDETAELATVFETSQKDAQIANQQAEMSSQRFITSLIVLGLVVTFLGIFAFFRHRSAKRLANAHGRLEEAHEKLQTAYNQLEEATMAKERIESELRIARDIQNSMLPDVFPDREGLDLHASMTAAKEVGGDLYGFLLEGDMLYFCIGDVSGKGIPASLFMAQATRLFRTLAAQHLKPAEITRRINDALTEDNEQGMFVTMFIGLINLSTGHLDFCNAGHNPPIVGNSNDKHGFHFLDMEPNAPIGLWPDLEFKDESLDNIKGCPFIAYTDGLTEAENKEQKQFGEERLLNLVQRTNFDNAEHADNSLKDEVEKFREGAEPNDDLTILCLRVS
jgi:serine phosphatase RsbU (regulator of sigma subunit)